MKTAQDLLKEWIEPFDINIIDYSFIINIMNEYAKIYHEQQVKNLNIPAVIKLLPSDEMIQKVGEDYAEAGPYKFSDNPLSDYSIMAESFINGARYIIRIIEKKGNIL